jgi:hypothetical protein
MKIITYDGLFSWKRGSCLCGCWLVQLSWRWIVEVENGEIWGPVSRDQANSGAEDKPQLLDSSKGVSSAVAEIPAVSHSNENEPKESTEGKSEGHSYLASETVAKTTSDIESGEASTQAILQNENSISQGAHVSQTSSLAALTVCVSISPKEISLIITRWIVRSRRTMIQHWEIQAFSKCNFLENYWRYVEHTFLAPRQPQCDRVCMILSWKMGGRIMRTGKEVDHSILSQSWAILITCRVRVTQWRGKRVGRWNFVEAMNWLMLQSESKTD